jgi:hypothetical protein
MLNDVLMIARGDRPAVQSQKRADVVEIMSSRQAFMESPSNLYEIPIPQALLPSRFFMNVDIEDISLSWSMVNAYTSVRP